ncbi:MAG: MBL fold metallo-hydrolase [Armatimonadetes bacterium]|nr:MBL fold metallo-hydrolase [Armatimonadota bacterium]CUU34544.1 phosphoribosyl 1,2-cyclic phosphate phosphodiesterase [Armatimonadetes bacterium DC]
MALTVTVLGCGTSMGVPMIGCRCAVCTSRDPRNHRTRPAVHLRTETTALLIDAPPELRLQLIRSQLDTHLDAVLITHTHADHIMGLDDVRGFTLRTNRPIPVYAEASALDDLKRVYRYVFFPYPPGVSTPQIEFREITGVFTIGDITVEPLRVFHGEMPILAFRVGNFAYVTDVSYIPPDTWERLQGLELLILDALRYQPHPTHYNLEQAIEVAQKLGAKRTLFTHMTHDFDYETVNAQLPDGIELAYDGLVARVGTD